jgi:hypothetical protein
MGGLIARIAGAEEIEHHGAAQMVAIGLAMF